VVGCHEPNARVFTPRTRMQHICCCISLFSKEPQLLFFGPIGTDQSIIFNPSPIPKHLIMSTSQSYANIAPGSLSPSPSADAPRTTFLTLSRELQDKCYSMALITPLPILVWYGIHPGPELISRNLSYIRGISKSSKRSICNCGRAKYFSKSRSMQWHCNIRLPSLQWYSIVRIDFSSRVVGHGM
jgi:hypothetical protein